MPKFKKALLLILKLCAAGLLFFSAQKSWAGFDFYQGYRAFKNKKFAAAADALAQALRYDASNPEILDLWIRNAWFLGVESKNKAWFEKAAVFSEQLNRTVPYFGRAWLYRAMSLLYRERLSGNTLDPDPWRSIKNFAARAYETERGSPWMGYMVSRLLLSEAPRLSPEEKQQALDWMKKSLSLHYSHQASPYLDHALRFLWERFSDPAILKYVTPPDALSYYRLLGFMEQHHLWAGRDAVWRAASQWSKAGYVPQCEKAEKFLKRGGFKRALFEFHAASWIDNAFVRAKAGVLICRQQIEGLDEDIDFKLKEILEEEEEDLSSLLDFLGGVVVLTEDPYLRGLFSFRQGDFASARHGLEIAGPELKHKFQRRYLAVSYWQLGEKQKAVRLVRQALDEKDPDLRELSFFKKWDTPYRAEILKRIESGVTNGKPETAWWREGVGHVSRLDRNGSVGVFISLKPGRAALRISMRAFPDPQGVYPYIRVRFWDHDRPYLAAESYRNHRQWKTAVFPIQTTGGNRLLQVELLNGMEPSSAGRGPVLELGALEIEYLP